MTIAALIPARAGSKGIPGKNTRVFAGKPLWQWAVEIGRQTCDETWVSTDIDCLGSSATRMGVLSIRRPPYLAQDDTPMLAVLQHALKIVKCDVVVLLQPTQPLRRAEHVRKALRLLMDVGTDSVVSMTRIPAHYSPDYACRIEDGQLVVPPATRRQDCRPVYSRDGTVYAIRRETIEAGSIYGRRCLPLIIPDDESCNLDTEENWQHAEWMVRNRDAIQSAG